MDSGGQVYAESLPRHHPHHGAATDGEQGALLASRSVVPADTSPPHHDQDQLHADMEISTYFGQPATRPERQNVEAALVPGPPERDIRDSLRSCRQVHCDESMVK